MLFQEFLREVLEISTRELGVGNDNNLSLSLSGNFDNLSQVAGLSLDLDAVVQECFELANVKHFVVGGPGSIDRELVGDLFGFLRRSACGMSPRKATDLR